MNPSTHPDHRPVRSARRAGYVVAVIVNVAMFIGVNRWPGWDAVPFLTEDTVVVLALVNASIVVNLAVNLIFLWQDPPRLKAAGDLASTSVGLFAMFALWQVFPLDVSPGMEIVARVLLVVGMVGSVIGILSASWRLVRPRVRAANPLPPGRGRSSQKPGPSTPSTPEDQASSGRAMSEFENEETTSHVSEYVHDRSTSPGGGSRDLGPAK